MSQTDLPIAGQAFAGLNEHDSLYRNQFVIAPEVPDRLDHWKRERLGDRWIAAHPSLTLLRWDRPDHSLVLLGFVLDPDAPERDDPTILDAIGERLVGGESMVEATAKYGGRWVLVMSSGSQLELLPDAAALRQVFYGEGSDGSAVCASQPDLVAEIVGAQPDPAAEAFIASTALGALNGRHWWPGDRSPYLGVRRLVANHVLDLGRVESSRVWPLRHIGRTSLADAVERGSQILRGMVDAAARRFELALFLTAGWDSRLVLAACRGLGDDALYLSNAYVGGDSLDQQVPAEILARLGLEHRLVPSGEAPGESFWELSRRNTSMARPHFATVAESLLPQLQQKRVGMTGHLAEIVKGFHLRPRFLGDFDGSVTASMVGMKGESFAIDAFDDWLSDIRPDTGVHSLDLLYWEQNAANMQASWLLEWDLIWGDAVIPMNSRRLLQMLLSVPYRHRRIGELHRRMIAVLWPETLAVPMKGKPYSAELAPSILTATRTNVRYVAKELKTALRYLRGERA